MIKLIKSSFYNEPATKKSLADFILDSEIFSMNEECGKFEKSFAAKHGRQFAVFVNSGSSANLLLIQALVNRGILKKGDKIGFSALTWPTNIMPLIQFGLEVLPLDCSLKTLNVSPEEIKKNLGGLKAMFLTNVLGFGDNLPLIKKICEEHKIILLEDNCESLGSRINDTLFGSFGLASTFSFYVGHHISTIEGGMILTDSHELYEALILARAHGWDRNLLPERQKCLREECGAEDFQARFIFYDLAFNVRPTEISGFLGNLQLNYFDEIVDRRQENFFRFFAVGSKNGELISPEVSHLSKISNFAYPVICRSKSLFEKYLKRFTRNEVEVRPVIAGNMQRQPFYKKHNLCAQECPNSDFITENAFYFGNNPELNEKEVNFLCNLLEP